jgi:hypothetical protein
MGQAAAMTGGYGNSYGQSVGQQAYQGYLQQLNDKVPELYQLALSKYQMEGDALMDQYGILGAKEEQEYGRHRDQVGDWERELARLQGQYQDERNFDYGRYSDDRNFGYGQYVDDRNFGYGQYIDDRNYQYQVGRDQVADKQWQAEFDEALRQFNFANGLGEFAPAAAGGGSGSGSGGKNWLNADGSVNLDMISQSSEWWKQYAAENGLDPKTGKKLGGPAEVVYDYAYVKDELNEMIRNGASKSDIGAQLRDHYKAGHISQEEMNALRENFTPRGTTY